jgi:hypothetical protein
MSDLASIAREAFGAGPNPQPVSETVPGTASNETPLTANDRCDVKDCGAQAFVRAEFKSGILLFCAHHYAEQPLSLQQSSISIHDERAKLTDARLDVSA